MSFSNLSEMHVHYIYTLHHLYFVLTSENCVYWRIKDAHMHVSSFLHRSLDLAQENPTRYNRDTHHFESNPCMNGHMTTVFYAQESHIPLHYLP